MPVNFTARIGCYRNLMAPMERDVSTVAIAVRPGRDRWILFVRCSA